MVDFAASFFNHVLDAGRVDAAVGDELFQCQPCDLAANRIKRRNRNGLGRVVDDEVDARDGFQSADVAAFAADDAAFHLVVGQRHNGDSRLGCVVSRTALDGRGNDLARFLIGFVFELRFDLFDLHGRLVADVFFHALEDVSLGLVLRQAGNALEHFHLAALECVDFFLLFVDGRDLSGQILFFLFVKIDLLIERFFLLLQAALLLGDFGAALLDLSFVFAA